MNVILFYRLKKTVSHLPIRTIAALLLFIVSSKQSIAQPADMAKLSLQLLLNTNGGSNNTADGCVVVFADGFSKGLGPEDSYKFNNLDENLAINCGGTSLSIEGRPRIVDADTVPLKMWQCNNSSYYFKLNGSNFPANVAAVIKDNYTQIDRPIDLTSTTLFQYFITADSGSFASDRFCLVFRTTSTLPLKFTLLKAFQKDKGVFVEWGVANEVNLHNYVIERSTNGIEFAKVADVLPNNLTSGAYSYFDRSASAGKNYYRIKNVSKTGEFTYSTVIKVDLVSAQSTIAVYPNPVKNKQVGLLFANVDKGRYLLKIYNTFGQEIYRSLIDKTTSGSGYQTININKIISKGIYRLSIISETNNYTSTIVFD